MRDRLVDLRGMDVSRETLVELDALVDLTLQWTRKINLISKGSIKDIWARHILDSLQLVQLAPNSGIWADLGSGGGFPALVVACDFKHTRPNCNFILVESDQRKATFLRTAAQKLQLNVTVVAKRIEQADPIGAQIVSARALAHLNELLEFAERHLAPGGVCLFPKGQNYRHEIVESLENWRFESEIHPSQTNPDAAILKIWNIERA